eukprot:122546-Rhodomonas_salina.2
MVMREGKALGLMITSGTYLDTAHISTGHVRYLFGYHPHQYRSRPGPIRAPPRSVGKKIN